jgi:hypothetical protein
MRALAVIVLAGTFACQAGPPPALDQGNDKADQISGVDDPSGLLWGAKRKLSDLVTSADVGRTFQVADELMPYPDTYWPMEDGGIDARWIEASGEPCDFSCSDPAPSPLEKYISLSRPGSLEDAKAWEAQNHGVEVRNAQSWWGHCPGWTGGAMSGPQLRHPVFARWTGPTGFEACEPGSSGCTKFEIGDINALMAEIYVKGGERLIGSKCGKDFNTIETDEHGRILDPGCKGLNPGTMLIVLGNRIKMDGKPFAIDHQTQTTTDEIWNQPVFGYTINRFQTLTEAEAANLVANPFGDHDSDLTSYPFNDKAKGFVLVDWTLHWVTETSQPNTTVVRATESAEQTRMIAVIELDAPASDPNASVIGGEYLEDPEKGASRYNVAPFAWIIVSPGSDLTDHNPYVRSAEVQQLMALGRDQSPTPLEAPPGSCSHGLCELGAPLDASCDSCVAIVCAEEPSCCESGWVGYCIGLAEESCDEYCY